MVRSLLQKELSQHHCVGHAEKDAGHPLLGMLALSLGLSLFCVPVLSSCFLPQSPVSTDTSLFSIPPYLGVVSNMPEAIEISWQVVTFDDSFDHKKTNLAFESTFYSFVEFYPNGGKEDFS